MSAGLRVAIYGAGLLALVFPLSYLIGDDVDWWIRGAAGLALGSLYYLAFRRLLPRRRHAPRKRRRIRRTRHARDIRFAVSWVSTHDPRSTVDTAAYYRLAAVVPTELMLRALHTAWTRRTIRVLVRGGRGGVTCPPKGVER